GSGPAGFSEGEPASGWGDTVTPCADGRELQDENTEYSPPCFDFSGDNGGATARGVTEDEITISYRIPSDTNLFALLGQLGGLPNAADTDRLIRDAEPSVEYFNRHFQFYCRRLLMVSYPVRQQSIRCIKTTVQTP